MTCVSSVSIVSKCDELFDYTMNIKNELHGENLINEDRIETLRDDMEILKSSVAQELVHLEMETYQGDMTLQDSIDVINVMLDEVYRTLYPERCKEKEENMGRYYFGEVPQIKNVIFNPPATIVYWKDGSKTVVKDEDIVKVHVIDDDHNVLEFENKYPNNTVRVNYYRWKEDGLLNAMMKKINPKYCDDLRKWCK